MQLTTSFMIIGPFSVALNEYDDMLIGGLAPYRQSHAWTIEALCIPGMSFQIAGQGRHGTTTDLYYMEVSWYDV